MTRAPDEGKTLSHHGTAVQFVDLAPPFLSHFFGLSQFALLHFGQTRGFSGNSRGSHSCPHRQRAIIPGTIPMGFSSSFFMASPFFAGKYLPRI
jgi:hypothetical protein